MTDFWTERRNVIRTRIGGARIGEGTVTTHGYSILTELAGRASFFQVLVLNVTGKLPERRLAEWMEATFICLSWPDPRIWCNTIGSFGGTMRTSPVAAVTAGVLASDSRMYGPGTALLVSETIARGLAMKRQGLPVSEIASALNRWPQKDIPVIPGFSRPIAAGDERVPVMDRISSDLGFGIGPHLALAYEIHNFFWENSGEGINLAGYLVAFLLDQGMTAKEIYRLYALCVNSGVHACYGEAYDNPPEAFLPLRCDDVDYQGRSYRSLPA